MVCFAHNEHAEFDSYIICIAISQRNQILSVLIEIDPFYLYQPIRPQLYHFTKLSILLTLYMDCIIWLLVNKWLGK